MKKTAVLLSSFVLTLSALNSTYAMSFSTGSRGSLLYDGVNLAIGECPVEVLKSDRDLVKDDTSGMNGFFYISLRSIASGLGSVYPSIPWTEPDPKSPPFDSGKHLGRTFENVTFGKITLGEMIQHEFGNGAMLSLNLFNKTDISRDLLSMHGAPTRSRHTVPEPAIMILVGTGLIGLAGYGKKKFKKP